MLMATEQGQGHLLWLQQKWRDMLKEKGNAKLRVTLKLRTMECHVWRWAYGGGLMLNE